MTSGYEYKCGVCGEDCMFPEECGTVGCTSGEKHLDVCPEELESLINQHRGAKKSFREGYSFSTKHGDIKREANCATRSWESKRKRVANKIKRLLKEIERLEREEVSFRRQRDIHQKRLDLAVNYEEYIKSVITNE